MTRRYRDVSNLTGVNPGYQYEFPCDCCDRPWVSPFDPARLNFFYNWLGIAFSILSVGGRAREETSRVSQAFGGDLRARALARAEALANAQFRDCPQCRKSCCTECLPAGASGCSACSHDQAGSRGMTGGGGGSGGGAQTCPSCQTRHDSGRFCPECGYDMASIQKTCPGCGTICARQTRYCPDCGHGF